MVPSLRLPSRAIPGTRRAKSPRITLRSSGIVTFTLVTLLVATMAPSFASASTTVQVPIGPGTLPAVTHLHSRSASTATRSLPATPPPFAGVLPPKGMLHPAYSWGGAKIPPGASAARNIIAGNPLHRAPGPRFGPYNVPSNKCDGVWPSVGGQWTYLNNCYGHDEPGIQFYSTMPGSGGNVTWNVTLPVERSPTQNQSSLYAAIWFGMTLTDPYAWLDQCFLELQFYPDSSPYGGNAAGSWYGAAVAWQIEADTGYEDACYYATLTVPSGSGYLQMSDGDHLNVTMTGWAGSTAGELITVNDLTSAQTSSVTLYNTYENYPLNPAYSQSSVMNSLQWTPGGEFPVVFAFETGHTVPPYPNSNAYGGCSAGVPPPTSGNPAVPCPSYDPGSWVNDTLEPWAISPPTFFNGSRQERPSQVSFGQDLGGIAFIDPISNYTCSGRDGSAFCSYPWYSYSCNLHAFEFGAADYPGVSADFGKYNEYAQTSQNNALQLGFYPPTNFSIPSCGAKQYKLQVGSQSPTLGSAYFLSAPYGSLASVLNVTPGEYSLSAIPAAGDYFSGWNATGSVRVTYPNDPVTTLWVAGGGTVKANFTTSAVPMVQVNFVETMPNASVAIDPSFYYTNGVPVATLKGSGSLNLTPGVYTIESYPTMFYNFSGYTSNSSGALLAAPTFPATWLDLTGNSTVVQVTINVVPSASYDLVEFYVYGSGTITFNGTSYSSGSSVTVPVGTYAMTAVPAASYSFTGWYYSSSAVMIDFRQSTHVMLEESTGTYIYADFTYGLSRGSPPIVAPALSHPSGTLYPVTFVADPPSGPVGTIGSTGLTSGNTVMLSAGSYKLSAAVGTNGTFLGWNGTQYVTPKSATASSTMLDVTGPGTIYLLAIGFHLGTPAANPDPAEVGGRLALSINVLGTGASSYNWSGLPPGCAPVDLPSFTCRPNATGNYSLHVVSVATGGINVTSPTGPLEVVPGPTLLSFSASVTSLTVGNRTDLNVTILNGFLPFTYLYTGLPVGCLSVNASTLSCVPTQSGSYPVNVTARDVGGAVVGAGLTLLVNAAPSVSSFSASPSAVDTGVSVLFATVATGGTGTLRYSYSGLPPGCVGADQATLTCAPTQNGNYSVKVTVSDADGRAGGQTTALVVHPDPSIVSFTVFPTAVDPGRTASFSVKATGGTIPYTYLYTGLPGGCTSIDRPSLACSSTKNGTYNVTIFVTDTFGHFANATTEFVINKTASSSPPPKGNHTPPPITINSTGPAKASTPWTTYAIFGGLIAVVAAAILVFVGVRRRPPPTGETAESESADPEGWRKAPTRERWDDE
ncbi:MAG: hypothetical protein L3K09_01425 [Thermoplasmata archaeon]|nr:hypothetical protein [Thermoplasmata archaeon]